MIFGQTEQPKPGKTVKPHLICTEKYIRYIRFLANMCAVSNYTRQAYQNRI